MCHNPATSDGDNRPADKGAPESIQWKYQIHRIHTGEDETTPYLIYSAGGAASTGGAASAGGMTSIGDASSTGGAASTGGTTSTGGTLSVKCAGDASPQAVTGARQCK